MLTPEKIKLFRFAAQLYFPGEAGVSMSLYQNIFFKFEIKFSAGWRHTSWSNWENPPKNIERYQISDKDLPTLINTSKQLFYAYESVKESPMLMSKQIYIDAVWKEKNIDIGNEIPQKENEISRLITTANMINREWQSMIRTFECEDYTMYQQVYICQVLPNIWLYASAVGDTKINYKSAKKQFLEISQLK